MALRTFPAQTEGKHAGEFILAEQDQFFSRKTGTLASGQKLVDGTLLQITSSKLVAKAVTLNTAGEFTVPIEGILIGNWDASATGTNADIPNVPYLSKLAIVKTDALTFPAGTPQKAAAIAELASYEHFIDCR